MTSQRIVQGPRTSSLADVLERVLDKGLVIAGDIKIKLVDIELLTIQVRLVVCSVDKAVEMGMDFWRRDPHFLPQRTSPTSFETSSAQPQDKVTPAPP
jgi:hypothetical protein